MILDSFISQKKISTKDMGENFNRERVFDIGKSLLDGIVVM